MMNGNLVRRIILYIADQLQDMGAHVSTIRIINILYLIDFEYYSRKSKTLTGLVWLRSTYGPSFMSLQGIISSLGIGLERKEELTERDRGFTFLRLGDQHISDIIDLETLGLINQNIKHWAYEELRDLLDFTNSTLPVKYTKFYYPFGFQVPDWARHLETEFQLFEAASEWDFKNFGQLQMK
jgi:hypothetical protein